MLRGASVALSLAAAGAFAVALSLAPAVRAQDAPKKDLLPDGPGKAITQQKCTQCHDAARFALLHHTQDEWDQVITQMQGYGLAVTDEEYGQVLDYLTKSFGQSGAPRNDDHGE